MSFGLISETIAPAVEHDQAIRDFMHVRQIMFDIDAGAPGLFDAAHEFDHFAHFGDAERRGGLVEHDEVGVVVHRPADRDALTFAAGKLPTVESTVMPMPRKPMVSIRIRLAISFSRLMSMKPNRLVICLPTKKLRHSGCFSARDLS